MGSTYKLLWRHETATISFAKCTSLTPAKYRQPLNAMSLNVNWYVPLKISHFPYIPYARKSRAFALGLRKATENLDRAGRSQDLPEARCLPASSPPFEHTYPNGSPCYAGPVFAARSCLTYLCGKQPGICVKRVTIPFVPTRKH